MVFIFFHFKNLTFKGVSTSNFSIFLYIDASLPQTLHVTLLSLILKTDSGCDLSKYATPAPPFPISTIFVELFVSDSKNLEMEPPLIVLFLFDNRLFLFDNRLFLFDNRLFLLDSRFFFLFVLFLPLPITLRKTTFLLFFRFNIIYIFYIFLYLPFH